MHFLSRSRQEFQMRHWKMILHISPKCRDKVLLIRENWCTFFSRGGEINCGPPFPNGEPHQLSALEVPHFQRQNHTNSRHLWSPISKWETTPALQGLAGSIPHHRNFGRLVLGCIEADFLRPNTHFAACFKIYTIWTQLHCSKFRRLLSYNLFFLQMFLLFRNRKHLLDVRHFVAQLWQNNSRIFAVCSLSISQVVQHCLWSKKFA